VLTRRRSWFRIQNCSRSTNPAAALGTGCSILGHPNALVALWFGRVARYNPMTNSICTAQSIETVRQTPRVSAIPTLPCGPSVLCSSRQASMTVSGQGTEVMDVDAFVPQPAVEALDLILAHRTIFRQCGDDYESSSCGY
jgi:hypothetical protein